jgi:hypothetical protein
MGIESSIRHRSHLGGAVASSSGGFRVARRISVLTALLTTMALLLTLVAAGSVSATKKDKKGGEGCTPGYWKQDHHFDSWAAPYHPTDSANTAFGVAVFSPDRTLLAALSTGGGGVNAFGRHAAAALLNAASGPVDYLWDVAQVKAAIAAAKTSGNWEAAKNLFAAQNELGCPLN